MTMASLKRLIAAGAAMATALLIAGCGGGEGAGAWGGSPVPGGGDSAPASMAISTSAPTVGSDGRTTATITAFVKDASNRSMANQQVGFSTPDSGAQLQVVSSRTDEVGAAVAVLSISDPTNRSIKVTGVSGSLSQSVSVAVIGSTITLNGPSSVALGASASYTAAVRDSSGAVVVGKPVSIKSAAGNTLSASTVTTDAAGQATFLLTGAVGGSDTLTVSALNADAAIPVAVAASQIAFNSPSPLQELQVAPQSHQVSVTYTKNGLPQAGQTIQFLATRGQATPQSAVTDGSGSATVTITSSSAGVSTITAISADGSTTSSQRVEFVSTTPTKLTLQASPANVAVNLSPTSNNSSQLIAVVRDAADNPVKGQTVSFTATQDPSNGRIEPAVATTDSSGTATVAFYPGANSTGNQAIRITASLSGMGVSGETALTATSQELSVRMGTGNTLAALDAATYGMPWTAVVTDASGNPVSGALVQAALISVGYRKGQYFWVSGGIGGSGSWTPFGETQSEAPLLCASEDANGNLRLDAGEDLNGDGSLTPGNVAAAQVLSADGRTDASGFASIRVSYPKDYGNWTKVSLRVTITTIAGTEGAAERTFLLPVLGGDLANQTVAPPGQPSPFGRLTTSPDSQGRTGCSSPQ
jgi:hypothetical protein